MSTWPNRGASSKPGAFQLIIGPCFVLGMLMYPPLQFRGIGRGYGWIFTLDDGLAVNASQLLVQWIGVANIGVVAYCLGLFDTCPRTSTALRRTPI